ncbi:DsbA family oxidoreductase [Pseudonocardia sp. CA-107938]|uniref:DsbA family oxidoreductase n=1 Tax=Pseudonocardia sp. CA-107938 TaxID=3240021 RepID=UPI003D8A2C95
MTVTIDIWSDIHCPWALVAVHRLRAARAAQGVDVVFAPRAWPLEWVNRRGTPRSIVTAETAVLAGHEPEIFNAYRDESWPSTFLPAFELVAAARRVGGPRAAEDVDYALRLAFFRDSVDVSIEAGLAAALDIAAGLAPALAADEVLDLWRHGNPRADVVADFRRSAELPIQGSPQIFWPDGTTTHNPGMTDHRWVGDLPRIASTDPGAAARLLAERTPARGR